MRMVLVFTSLLVFIFQRGIADEVKGATSKSSEFTIETGITPTPKPLQSFVQTGFLGAQNAKPMQLAISSDLVDYGPITPTNPIIRQLSLSVDAGSSQGYVLFTFENHPLAFAESTIPDTSCDDGSCTEKKPSIWINPFTFGLGFSFDDRLYQQFPDASKNEPMVTIPSGKMTIKLNVNQTQPLPSDKHYEHTITFLAVPKF